MKRKCLICSAEYNPQDSGSFFNFKYCSDACELKAEIEARSAATGVHMYMCISPLSIHLVDSKKDETVAEGTKWRRDDSQSKGLNTVHLVNMSGLATEKIGWLEVDKQALSEHFQKI